MPLVVGCVYLLLFVAGSVSFVVVCCVLFVVCGVFLAGCCLLFVVCGLLFGVHCDCWLLMFVVVGVCCC